ncbi:DEAD/DEAH box helicase [uncultured Salinibacterium sp.]|uniref:DEAD/DEAH box helicase n=1 Tax=uncultured Salinibacterium sp. TaxID=459274 RepID=UPI0030DCA390
MKFSPLKHQELAIAHLVENDEAALFAGMGLGKTASTLAAISERILSGDAKGFLIVSPLRVTNYTWPAEVAKWEEFRWLTVANLRTPEGLEAWDKGTANVYLINYESLPKLCKLCMKGRRSIPVDGVVWDELSKAKANGKKAGTRIKEFRKYKRFFTTRWGLTGTPMPNGELDLFGQVLLLDNGKRFGEFITHFRDRYFYQKQFDKYGYHLHDGAAEKIQEKISDLALVLRSEDYLDIPPTRLHDIEVTLPPKVMTAYKRLEKDLLIDVRGSEVVAPNAAALSNKLLQITGGTVYAEDENETRTVETLHSVKIEALKKLLSSEKSPLLIATNYKHEQARIVAAVDGAEIFDETSLERWNAGKIRALVAHPASIGHGLNLQDGSSRLCWFSLTWSRELYDQFNARLARTGQKHETHIHRILAKGTIDEAVAEALRHKGDNQSSLMAAIKMLQLRT